MKEMFILYKTLGPAKILEGLLMPAVDFPTLERCMYMPFKRSLKLHDWLQPLRFGYGIQNLGV